MIGCNKELSNNLVCGDYDDEGIYLCEECQKEYDDCEDCLDEELGDD